MIARLATAFVCSCTLLGPLGSAARAQLPSAELLYFTDDATASGAPLLPGFFDHSVWSGLCASREGDIYVSVSNHQQPGGNCAVYRYQPDAGRMTLLGDLESTSTAADNWMAGESQYKVHSFLFEDPGGRIWFASDDHPPTPFLRGAHLYTIDTATGVLTDFSKTQPWLLTEQLQVKPNPGLAAVQSGVFIETYGIKGLGYNRRAPDVLYAMTYPDGHLIRYGLGDGMPQVIGQSTPVSYVFYVDNRGDVFYAVAAGDGLALLKYERASGQTQVVAPYFPGVELGAIAPTAGGQIVYVLEAETTSVYRLDCAANTFNFFASTCGTNWWRLYNLALSPNGEALYYVSNNNDRSTVRRVDLASQQCSEVLDVDALLGDRNLCFGGIDVWDHAGNLYAPVWRWSADSALPTDLALLRVALDEAALEAAPPTLSLSSGGVQTLDLAAGPDNAGALYVLLGSASGTSPGFLLNDLLLPLAAPDPYFESTLLAPNRPPLQGSLGLLDSHGRASAGFHLPAGAPPALAGLTLHHAFAAFDPQLVPVFTSPAVDLAFTP